MEYYAGVDGEEAWCNMNEELYMDMEFWGIANMIAG